MRGNSMALWQHRRQWVLWSRQHDDRLRDQESHRHKRAWPLRHTIQYKKPRKRSHRAPRPKACPALRSSDVLNPLGATSLNQTSAVKFGRAPWQAHDAIVEMRLELLQLHV